MGDFTKSVVKIAHHGREIYGVAYMPQNVDKCPVVIFSHGYNGVHTDFAMNSEYLASNGIGAYCFDFCGGSVNSKSDLRTTEMTLFTEKEDLSAIVDAVQSWEQVDRNNLFLFGGSQGGLISALVADERVDDIKGLLLLFPAFSIPENWNSRFPTADVIPESLELWGMNLGRVFFESLLGYSAFEHIGKYDKNVLILHGDKDEIIALDVGQKAAKLYPQVQIEIFEGEGHGFSEAGNKRVVEMTLEFVRANVV